MRTWIARLFVVFGLAFSLPALAGGNYITGIVVDRNAKPVPRAIVSLVPGNVELVTDQEGRFLIDYTRDDEGNRSKLPKRTEYALEIFKPGYHVEKRDVYYKRGGVEIDQVMLISDTIEVEDDGQNIDPALYADQTHSSGANYEGQ